MTEQKELLLREILLDMAADPTEDRLDEIFPSLLLARYDLADRTIGEETHSRHIEAIRTHAAAHRNGHAPWLFDLLKRGRDRRTDTPRRLWPAMTVFAAVALIFVLILLNLPRTRTNEPVAHEKGAPTRHLRNKPEQPRVVHKEEPRAPESPVKEPHPNKTHPRRSVPRLKPEPRDKGLVAQRVDVGKFGPVMGEPTVTVFGEKKGKNALPNMTITTAMRIQTGDADMATITFNDGTTLALSFNTTLEIPASPSSKIQVASSKIQTPKSDDSKLQTPNSKLDRPDRVRLLQGQVLAKVVHGKTAEQFAVETRVATAVDLGTEFSLELTHERVAKKVVDRAILQVREGRVRFFNDYGFVEASMRTETTAVAGTKPTEPKRVGVMKTISVSRDHAIIFVPHAFDLPGNAGRLALHLGVPGFELVSSPGMAHAVKYVFPDTPAARSGLRTGDLVTSVDGRPVENDAQVYREFFSKPGGTVRLTIQGHNGLTALAVTTGEEDVRAFPQLSKDAASRLRAATWPALEGDLAVSSRRLQTLLQVEPSGSVYNNLGLVFELENEMGKAIRAYESAIRLDSGCAKFHYNLGMALSQIGNVRRAVEELERAEDLRPGWSSPPLELAMLYVIEGRSEKALRYMDTYIAKFPRNAFYLHSKAAIFVAMRRPEVAVSILRKAVATDPDSASLWDELALALDHLDQTGPALDAARRAIGIDPQDSNHYNTLALILWRSNPAAAERAIRKAIEIAPNEANSHNTLAVILRDRKKFKEAEAEYRAAIALDSGFLEAHDALGKELLRIGRIAEAEAEFREMIRLDPDNADGYKNLGAVYMNYERRAKEAEELFKKGLTLTPNDPDMLNNLAVCYDSEGKYDEAVAVLRKALPLAPDNPNTLNSLAYDLAMTGKNLDEALVMARKAVKIDPLDFITETLGFVLFKHGDLDEAVATIKKAIGMWNGPPVSLADAYVDLGAVYEKKGDVKTALEQYRKALSLNPQQKVAQEAIKRLGG
ncbi:MAG: tetratricopeptide repeat protein [Fimbriimonadales bacterium]